MQNFILLLRYGDIKYGMVRADGMVLSVFFIPSGTNFYTEPFFYNKSWNGVVGRVRKLSYHVTK
jgi:hypothetical protein